MTAGFAALALLLVAFQNCGMDTGMSSMKASNQTKILSGGPVGNGNGEGYGGKIQKFYSALVACPDKKPHYEIEQRGLDFYILRENCADVAEVLIPRGAVENLKHAQTLAIFDNRVYKTTFTPPGSGGGTPGCTPTPGVACEQPRNVIAKHFCRGSDTQVAYPRKIVDIVVDHDASAKSISDVTIVNYSAEESPGAPFTRKVNSNVTVSMASSGPVYNYAGILSGGESYNLSLDTLKNGNLSYVLGIESGVNQALKCYPF